MDIHEKKNAEQRERKWGRESHWNSAYIEYMHLSAMKLFCIVLWCGVVYATVESILKVCIGYHMIILTGALCE